MTTASNPWTTTLDSDHTYKAAWRMPEDVERLYRDVANDGYTLNVCAGKLDVGDVLVDADPQLDRSIPADMNNLPFDDATFDYVLLDPPWKLNYYKRQRPFFEAVRVCKPDGLILANWLWIGESENTRIEPPLIIRCDDAWANISAIVAHRKQPNQANLATWGAGNDSVPTRPNPRKWTECGNCGDQVLETEAVESNSLSPPKFCSWECCHEVEYNLLRPDEHMTPPETATKYYAGPLAGEGGGRA